MIAGTLVVIAALYVAIVALYRIAFGYFTGNSVDGLFPCFAGGMVLGVVAPIVYTVWVRGRPLHTLGFTVANWRQTVVLGRLFAAVQFSITCSASTCPPTRSIGCRCW